MHRKQNKLSCQLSADEIDDAHYINTEFNLLGEWVVCGVNACWTSVSSALWCFSLCWASLWREVHTMPHPLPELLPLGKHKAYPLPFLPIPWIHKGMLQMYVPSQSWYTCTNTWPVAHFLDIQVLIVPFSSPPQIISLKNIIKVLGFLFWFSGKGDKSEHYVATI